jgi:hypothetical protein
MAAAASACRHSSDATDPPASEHPGVTSPQASAPPGAPSATTSIDSTHLPPAPRNTTAIQPYVGHPGWNLITCFTAGPCLRGPWST